MSIYGGAGGLSTKISWPKMANTQRGGFNLADAVNLQVWDNEKATMQNLNDRLASYLEKVSRLEEENQRLEKQIREWYQNRTVVSHDHSSFFAIMNDLKEKIQSAARVNARIVLDADNAKLAADDFRMKYENELAMRMAVEADVGGLRNVLDQLNISKMNLESQYEAAKEDLIMLKRNHEEEVAAMRAQVGGQVNVAVDTPPSTDLNQALTEIRKQYESNIAKSRTELETWYQNKIAVVETDVTTNTESLMMSRTEIKELKSTVQRLQIDLQSNLSLKSSLEGTLAETQNRYAMQLAGLQNVVLNLEAELSQLHANLSSNKQDYDILLDVKTRLQLEIAEYRRLLEGEDESSSRQVVKKVITVVERVVDGKVIESNQTVDVDVEEITE